MRVEGSSEAAGVEQGPGDVVTQVPDSQGSAAQVLQAPVDRFYGAVARTRVIEERQHISNPALQRPPQGDQLHQRLGNTADQGSDHRLHQGLARRAVSVPVGGHALLVHTPGHLE